MTTSTENSTKINGLLENAKEAVVSSKNNLKEEQKLFLEYNKTIDDLIKSVNENIGTVANQIEEYDKQLNFVESKTDYFKERNEYLDTLISREVGASLFETFEKRKRELSKKSNLLAIGVFISATLLLGGIYFIFQDLVANGSIQSLSWELFALRSLKTLPFAVLLYFVIRQYNKERNFQEEYAFKSACALTINEYAKILKNDESKDKLILEGVLGVYQSPIHEKEKKEDTNKKILEIGKDLAESVKNVTKK